MYKNQNTKSIIYRFHIYPISRPVTDNVDTLAEFLRKYRQVC